METHTDALAVLLISALCAGAGGFLGSYLKKKGENLVTHEDIDMLVKQMSAVTTATKEIEARYRMMSGIGRNVGS